MRGWWKHISGSVAVAQRAAVLRDLDSQALQGRPPYAPSFLDDIVDDWLDPISQINVSLGLPRAAGAYPCESWRCGYDNLRWTCWLQTTGTGVDDAMDAFIDVYETWLHARARSA